MEIKCLICGKNIYRGGRFSNSPLTRRSDNSKTCSKICSRRYLHIFGKIKDNMKSDIKKRDREIIKLREKLRQTTKKLK